MPGFRSLFYLLEKSNFFSCSCCLNQPDLYCKQLNCKKMKPDFGSENNSTSCLCFQQTNYPINICSLSSDNEITIEESEKLWQNRITPIEKVIASTSIAINSNFVNSSKKLWFMDFLENSRNGMWILLIILLFGLFTGLLISFICLKRVRRQGRKERNVIINSLDELRIKNELEPLATTIIDTNT